MSEIFYPTIDLFLYDLISGFGDDPGLVEKISTKL